MRPFSLKARLKGVIKKLIFNSYRIVYGKKVIYVDYRVWKNNFGDLVNKFLIETLSGKKVVRIESEHFNFEHVVAIGSVLGNANMRSIVWGSGFIADAPYSEVFPGKVVAVRGKLSREKLLSNGVDCPEVYGDPALLLPKVYNPHIRVKYKVGIIPHYVDKECDWVQKVAADDASIKIIDIQQPNPLSFIDDMLACEIILSSSLHGIIVADAYNIKNCWIRLSDKLIGGEFKFNDYFSSVNKSQTPIDVKPDTELQDILDNVYEGQIDFNSQLLLAVAPFFIDKKYL